MGAVLAGFFTIWSVVAVGWVLAHFRVLDDSSQLLLSRLSFFVGNPALMVTMVSTADLERIFALNLLVSIAATLASLALYLAWAWLLDRRGRTLGHTAIGAFCSCYVNASNMGLPIATYVLHDVTWVAPILLVQVAVLQPIGLSALDVDAARRGGGEASRLRNMTMPLRNPMTVGVLLGLAINLLGWRIPAVLDEPLTMLGALAVPTMLIAFGVSLRLSPLPRRGPLLRETVVTCVLKLLVHPLLALLLARLAGLDHTTTLAVMVLAGLPTAQNVFVHSVRYGQSVDLARNTVLVTSIASIGTVTAMALLV